MSKLKFSTKAFTKAMIEKRTKESLSTRVAAEQVGIPFPTFNAMEFGRNTTWPIETVLKIVNWLNKPLKTFIHE